LGLKRIRKNKTGIWTEEKRETGVTQRQGEGLKVRRRGKVNTSDRSGGRDT